VKRTSTSAQLLRASMVLRALMELISSPAGVLLATRVLSDFLVLFYIYF